MMSREMKYAFNQGGINMYVVSVMDNGNQRTFVSESLKILDRIVYATISGSQREFSLADILDIVPIYGKGEAKAETRRGRHSDTHPVARIVAGMFH